MPIIPPRPTNQVVCKACNGSGLNSKGAWCYPCRGLGRLKAKETK
jgi:DnaJ-class molecular chaperone